MQEKAGAFVSMIGLAKWFGNITMETSIMTLADYLMATPSI
jgi:hypothetical protein